MQSEERLAVYAHPPEGRTTPDLQRKHKGQQKKEKAQVETEKERPKETRDSDKNRWTVERSAHIVI